MSSANAAAAQQFANRAASGQPLDVLFQQFGQVEAQELLNLIMSEIQQGVNPRQMARDITGALDQIDYGRAETIARTESLGSWNDAALANYQANSDIVGSWMWMCFPGAGTCVGCLEEDGTIYGLDEELNDHPNGRCVKAPITNDYGAILSDYGIDTEGMDFGLSPWDARQTGEEWLLAQDEATQIAAFGGKAPYYAWRSGDVPLKAFTKHVHDPVWGDHVAQQSLRGMGLNARDYAEGTIKERLAKQAAQEAYAATPIGQAEARVARAEQRARELEAMMAQAMASGAARDAVLADYYHSVLVERLSAQFDLERLKEAQATGEAAAREAEAAGGAEQAAVEEARSLGTLEDIKAREAQVEDLYGGTTIGDPMTLQEAAFGNNPYSIMSGTALPGADPATVAAVQQGQQLLEEAMSKLATRLEDNRTFLRFARYMGYDQDAIDAHLVSWGNAQRLLADGRTLSEEDARLAVMTRAEAQAWAKQEALKSTIYDIFEAFHSIPAIGEELWVQTPLQIAMQEAVKAEFGLKSAAGYWSDEAIAAAQAEWGTYRNGIRAFFRAMHDETQSFFQEQGITEVQLFRGLRWTADKAPADVAFDGRVVESVIQQAPMTSWASNAEVALDYARDIGGTARPATAEADYGMLVATRVPVDQILSTPFTGFGTPSLRELIMLGVPDDALALPFTMDNVEGWTLDDFLNRLAAPEEHQTLG